MDLSGLTLWGSGSWRERMGWAEGMWQRHGLAPETFLFIQDSTHTPSSVV